ncbi:MAG TPA: 3-oxoacyl-[acyl-carrier-protein] synthase III C-terminal domain-containing protein [Steroidobacteraceae bacterium]|jgi:alkylresorcinol/alkylpyrone synthase|nr:3-oxoacyl-[acyl-carrier-protein] synthase III C-terminal domain-containing protein [Steroidobacteraceae bacterium]
MYLNGIGTATPPARYTKVECWEAFRRSDWFERLSERTRALARVVLLGDNGMEARRLAVASLAEVFRIDPDTLHRRFLQTAPELATRAGAAALDNAGASPHDIDAVVVSTCTGYLCPGLTGYVIERLGLRPDTGAFDLVGQGCAAAVPNMRLAQALIGSRAQRSNVLSICVEVSSAAMYLDDDPGVLISACLFGDGAGAAVFSNAPSPGRRRVLWQDSESLLEPGQRAALMFEQRGGMLRNVLTRPVPQLAAECAGRVLASVLGRARLQVAQIGAWIMHAGGRDVLRELEQRLQLSPRDLRYSAEVLREYGNLSSAFVYFVLQAALTDGAAGGWWWLGAFGAGFSSHGALLRVD